MPILRTIIAAMMLSVSAPWLPVAGWIAPATAIAGGVLAVATGWGLKVMLITRAAFTRGHVIQHTPARGRDPSHVVTPT